MEAYPGQTRVHVIIGSLLGLMIGVFMQNFLIANAGAFRLAWLAIFAAIGGLMGKLLVVAQAPRTPPVPADEVASDDPEVSATRFFKLQSGVFSSEELRRLRVRSVTMPMSPPDSELQLQVRDFDHFCRVPVLEGVLERLTVEEVAERMLAEASTRAPKVPGELALKLVSFHSEGPLGPDGRCPLGWSFYAVDGRNGLGCLATTTDREIALHFHTAATYSAPAEWEWVELEDVLKWVEAALPAWSEQSRIRVNLPDDYLCFVTNPLRIADIDIREGMVVNESFLAAPTPVEETECFDLDDLLAWFRGGALESEHAADLLAALEDPEFADGLRTLRSSAIGRAAIGLERAAGPAIVRSIVAEIAAAEDPAERAELLHILSRTPTGLAQVALHRLSVEGQSEDTVRVASELHHAWRRGQIDVPRHPLDSLSFLEARRRMGRGELAVVPLVPTYDPENVILPALEILGFRETRRRMLSGAANLLVGAQLRAVEGDAELLLTSTPLPVPCHILHVVGGSAAQVARRIESTPIVYPSTKIVSDIATSRPALVHQGALYVAALRIDSPDLYPHLVETLERGRSNEALRRAIISALAVQSDPGAKAYLEGIGADELLEDARVAKESTQIKTQIKGSAPSV